VANGDSLPDVPYVVPAVPASAGAMIFDRKRRLLILKPTYKSGWTIPGGVMEADGETPWEACQREVREECGLQLRTGRLACVDFRRRKPGNAGGVRFLFDCGILDDARLAAIVLQSEEISDYRFEALPTALTLLRKPIRRRVKAANRARSLVYLEQGRPVPGVGGRGRSSALWRLGVGGLGAGQSHDADEEVVDLPDRVHELLELHRLADVGVGVQRVAAQHVLLRP
jgi:8-oxo-dGTP diphosphatase